MKYIVQETTKYSDIDIEVVNRIKKEKLPLVCLTGIKTEHPRDFNYVVFDKNNEIKGKFIELDDAKEYAEFLSLE